MPERPSSEPGIIPGLDDWAGAQFVAQGWYAPIDWVMLFVRLSCKNAWWPGFGLASSVSDRPLAIDVRTV